MQYLDFIHWVINIFLLRNGLNLLNTGKVLEGQFLQVEHKFLNQILNLILI